MQVVSRHADLKRARPHLHEHVLAFRERISFHERCGGSGDGSEISWRCFSPCISDLRKMQKEKEGAGGEPEKTPKRMKMSVASPLLRHAYPHPVAAFIKTGPCPSVSIQKRESREHIYKFFDGTFYAGCEWAFCDLDRNQPG